MVKRIKVIQKEILTILLKNLKVYIVVHKQRRKIIVCQKIIHIEYWDMINYKIRKELLLESKMFRLI